MIFKGKMSWVLGVSALVLFCIAGMGIVSAVDVSSPDVAKPGDTVSVYVGNIDPNSFFELTIDGLVKANSANEESYTNFTYYVENLILPFTVINPNLTVEVRDLKPNLPAHLAITPGGPGVTQPTDNAGTWFFSGSRPSIAKSTPYLVEFNSWARKSQIPVRIIINGTVSEQVTTPVAVTFNTRGFSNAIYNAYIYLNHNTQPVAQRAFTIQDSLLAYRS
jgi:hypothetical protein